MYYSGKLQARGNIAHSPFRSRNRIFETIYNWMSSHLIYSQQGAVKAHMQIISFVFENIN
jgi:hypothetical protein